MNAALTWLAGAPERGAWVGNSDSPRLRRPAVEQPWQPGDARGYVIERTDPDGSRWYFVESPPGWTPRWRAASCFEGRSEAERLVAPKTDTAPAGPAAEIGAQIVKLQNGFPG